jgi:quercetin dioxygenase-like cupin family protein
MATKPKYKLVEKPWLVTSEKKTFENRKSSEGCDLKVYVHGGQLTGGSFTIPPHKRLGRISAHPADETYYVVRGTLKVLLPRLNETVTDDNEECFVIWHTAPDWP